MPAKERPRFLERAWQRVREEVAAGRQAYVVCPRISSEQSGESDDRAAGASGCSTPAPAPDTDTDTEDRPDTARPPRDPLAVLDVAPALASQPAGRAARRRHAREASRPHEKDRVMTAFTAGEVDVLVSTTVIEVGVDVPNATTMVIMDAERFGVSQLHQLRGRVGRGEPRGAVPAGDRIAGRTALARERLDKVAETGDGFRSPASTSEQRREGDVLGSAQAGRRSSLKLLRLLADEDLIASAREEATALVEADPQLAAHSALKDAIDDILGDRRAEFLDKASIHRIPLASATTLLSVLSGLDSQLIRRRPQPRPGVRRRSRPPSPPSSATSTPPNPATVGQAARLTAAGV